MKEIESLVEKADSTISRVLRALFVLVLSRCRCPPPAVERFPHFPSALSLFSTFKHHATRHPASAPASAHNTECAPAPALRGAWLLAPSPSRRRQRDAHAHATAAAADDARSKMVKSSAGSFFRVGLGSGLSSEFGDFQN
jgi:hypothetical protein